MCLETDDLSVSSEMGSLKWYQCVESCSSHNFLVTTRPVSRRMFKQLESSGTRLVDTVAQRSYVANKETSYLKRYF